MIWFYLVVDVDWPLFWYDKDHNWDFCEFFVLLHFLQMWKFKKNDCSFGFMTSFLQNSDTAKYVSIGQGDIYK